MADIFREVDEELREDRAKQLWARYGKYVIGGAVAVVAIVAGVIGWDNYQASQKADASARFEQLLQSGGEADLRQRLTEFAGETTPGYSVVARLRAAAIAREQGDADAALATYRDIATSAEADPLLQDLSALLAASILADRGDSAGVDGTVVALTAEGHPLRYQALELQAVAALAAGDSGKARGFLDQIVGADDATSTLQARAAELIAALE
ncbi:MAG: tetratricopeptide repeat protein [Alphaproteobacteria bacterium]|nr:tetratricopeptide repeat protein [Alphaproteobacteria bacterium]